MIFGSITRMNHGLIKEEIAKLIEKEEQLIGVDCTMGNGHDTLFMTQLFGDKGHVYSFDIQQLAIDNTKVLLEKNDVSNVELILRGHEHLDDYVENAHLVMFNLGYLPKGDHGLITLPETTLMAIEKSLQCLCRNGLLSIITYYGHEGGIEEKNAVDAYVSGLDPRKFEVMQFQKVNRPNNPPIVTIIRKN